LIPGYYATFLFIDWWGRKPIQLMGFIVLTIVFITMVAKSSILPRFFLPHTHLQGFGYSTILQHSPAAFVFLYCLASFFQNFGPNCTTFIIPGEAFPTRYRSTAHGISAASGKLGAICGQCAFAFFAQTDHTLEIYALFMFTGIFSTLLIPETMGRTLEDISGENDEPIIEGV
jgi:PHS family inorganic phosphate transporter-like MFS transporter